MSPAYLDVHEVHRTFRSGATRGARPARGVAVGGARRARRRARPLRLGQDHPAQRRRRPRPTRRGPGRARRRRRHGDERCRAARGASRHGGLRVPVVRAGADPHGARERRDPVAAERGRAGRSARTRVAAALEHVGPRPATSTSVRASCRVGSSSGWRWPVPWRPGRGCSWPTSPPGQLDSETGREIMMLIARLAKEETMTTVVTTHDPVLLSIADRVRRDRRRPARRRRLSRRLSVTRGCGACPPGRRSRRACRPRLNIRPMPRPRPPCAEGECCA